MSRIELLVLLVGLTSCVGATDPPTTSPTTSPVTPTTSPTTSPTSSPTASPTTSPTTFPTTSPTTPPTTSPTISPTSLPTTLPTKNPTARPTTAPTTSPTTSSPTTSSPTTSSPTTSPASSPTSSPTPSTSSPTSSPSKPTITYTGYVVDTLCLTIINTNDYTNTTLNPENHTLYCLKLPWCRDSGYSVLEHKGEYYESKYQIAMADTPLVTAVLDAASCTSNFSVTVVGTVSGSLGDATYEGSSTYNNGSLSFGTVLDITSITGHCGGNVVLPPANVSGSGGGDGDDPASWTVGAVIAVVVCVVIVLVIIVGIEMAGRKAERPKVDS